MDDRTPILIGCGQLTQREVEPEEALSPLNMMVETARRAADDSGSGVRLLEQVDSIAVNAVLFWRYDNAPRLLAERIGAHPTDERTTAIGGNSPQLLVNDTAERIATGRVRLALLAGAEAAATLARARKKAVPV